MSKPEIYKSVSVPPELIKTIRVTGLDTAGKIASYIKHLMFSVRLLDIKAGDVISISAYGQVSNANVFSYDDHRNPKSAIMFCHGTILAANATDLIGIEELTETRGTNITAEVHHMPWDEQGHYEFTKDYPIIYVNQIVYAATAALKPGSTPTYLTVDQDYGRSAVLLWR